MHIATLITMAAGCVVGIGVIWLCLGRQISGMMDLFIPGRSSAQPIEPLLINSDAFVLGSRNWPLPRSGEFELKVAVDPRGQLVLSVDGRAFTFGPVQKMWVDPVAPQFLFVPAAGDVVSFTREIGRLPWPTPFTFSILGGSVPKWKRYVYDRLRWKKADGATLEITWWNEYWFYRAQGWSDCYNNRLSSIRIRPASIRPNTPS